MSQKKIIGLIDYGAGNITSLSNAFHRLGEETCLTADKEALEKCRALVIPGVGSFGQAMQALKKLNLDTFLQQQALSGKLIFGICLGLQLFFSNSEEDNNEEGLGLLPGKVVRFRGSQKVPHMGWNRLYLQDTPLLFAEVPDGSYFYFVHSYYVVPREKEDVWGVTNYDVLFPAAVGRDNIIGVQFHPEKSGSAGLKVLAGFLKILSDRER